MTYSGFIHSHVQREHVTVCDILELICHFDSKVHEDLRNYEYVFYILSYLNPFKLLFKFTV